MHRASSYFIKGPVTDVNNLSCTVNVEFVNEIITSPAHPTDCRSPIFQNTDPRHKLRKQMLWGTQPTSWTGGYLRATRQFSTTAQPGHSCRTLHVQGRGQRRVVSTILILDSVFNNHRDWLVSYHLIWVLVYTIKTLKCYDDKLNMHTVPGQPGRHGSFRSTLDMQSGPNAQTLGADLGHA